MIEESFVSFDTARMLKEAGFEVPCRSYYELEDGEIVRKDSIGSSDYNAYEDTVCSRPTQALAARWLREVHGVYIEIHHRVTGYVYFVIKIESNELLAIPTISDKMQFDIYEEAFENALRKAIKLIKK